MQIFHTGREEYDRPSGWNFDAAEFARQYGQDQVAIEKYKQAITMQREQEFLSLMDVNTDNLIFEQYQMKAAEDIDNFVKEATTKFKNKNGILSTQDKMELQKTRQQMQMKIDGMRAKAKQFLDVKEMYGQYYDSKFDVDETNQLFKDFLKDPVKNEVPMPVPRYMDANYLVKKYADQQYGWESEQDVTLDVEGGKKVTTKMRLRRNINSDADARKVLKEWVDNDFQLKRTLKKYYNDDINALYSDVKEELYPDPYKRISTAGGGGINIGFTKGGVDFTITNEGRTFGVTGTPKPMTWGDEKVIFEGITDGKVRLRPAKLEQEPDYALTKEMGFEGGADTQDKLSLDIYGGIYKVGGTIQVDGKWYYKKRGEVREVELNDNVIKDLKESLKGYSTFAPKFNEWLGKNKSNQPVSKPTTKKKKANPFG